MYGKLRGLEWSFVKFHNEKKKERKKVKRKKKKRVGSKRDVNREFVLNNIGFHASLF